MEGWTSLAALAQATSRARLGILVTGNTYRHPAVLAKQATTVDHISGGRLIFGLGAGWHEYEHAAFGIGLPPVKERMDRLEESAEMIKALWTESRPASSGSYYSLDRPPYNPANVQQPHPPILIGGGGEKRTLRIVAKYADVANVQGTPEEVAHKWQVLDEALPRDRTRPRIDQADDPGAAVADRRSGVQGAGGPGDGSSERKEPAGSREVGAAGRRGRGEVAGAGVQGGRRGGDLLRPVAARAHGGFADVQRKGHPGVRLDHVDLRCRGGGGDGGD